MRHLSGTDGIGGVLKAAPQDFLVEEIAPDGAIYELGKPFSRPDEEGPFVHFILQKKNWTSVHAVSEIAKAIRMQQRDLSTAGMKDKTSISTQLVSVYKAPKEAVLSLSIKDLSVLGAWTAPQRVRMGQLLGNRFTITVRDITAADATDRCEAIKAELDGRFPNYFGGQRFGSSRRNTHLIGEKMLRGETEDALMMFLCDTSSEKNPLVASARKELADTRDFARALSYFPKHLALERSVISYLARNGGHYADAFKRLPRNITLLFIHAFQSHLFNSLLSERLGEGPVELEEGEYFCGETLGFPDTSKTEGEGWICGKLIGYSTPLNEREQALLETMGISKEAFRMPSIPQVASRGSYRTLLSPMKDFYYGSGIFRFSLPAGSYATVAMREWIDAK